MSDFTNFIKSLLGGTLGEVEDVAPLTREQLLEIYNPNDHMPITIKHLLELMAEADKHMDIAEDFHMPLHKNDKEGLETSIKDMKKWMKVCQEFHSALINVDCQEGTWYQILARCAMVVTLQKMYRCSSRNVATFTAFAQVATGEDNCKCETCMVRRGEIEGRSEIGLENLLAVLDEEIARRKGKSL